MKLKEIINKLEKNEMLNGVEYKEFLKRIKQIKAYFNYICKDGITVIGETISNVIQYYYINTDDTKDTSDFISDNNLLDGLETGHVTYWDVI